MSCVARGGGEMICLGDVFLGDMALVGEGAWRGEIALGEAILGGGRAARGGDVAFGGEYVRGDPNVAGERNPVGDAEPGNGRPDRTFLVAIGVPAICSSSALKSRGTAEGSNPVDSGQRRIPKPTPVRC